MYRVYFSFLHSTSLCKICMFCSHQGTIPFLFYLFLSQIFRSFNFPKQIISYNYMVKYYKDFYLPYKSNYQNISFENKHMESSFPLYMCIRRCTLHKFLNTNPNYLRFSILPYPILTKNTFSLINNANRLKNIGKELV